MKQFLLIGALLLVAGCTRTVYVPQAFMPSPPETLMAQPARLDTIEAHDDNEPR